MKNSSQDNNYKTNNNQDDKQNNNQENNDKDRLIKQIKFIEEIDKEKLIGRQTYLADASRKENDDLVRISVGIEDVQDLIEDFTQALKAAN